MRRDSADPNVLFDQKQNKNKRVGYTMNGNNGTK